MRPRRPLFLTGIAWLGTTLSGCEQSYTATLLVGSDPIIAGEPQEYSVLVSDEDGHRVSGGVRIDAIEVTPDDGVVPAGETLTFAVATSYHIVAHVHVDEVEATAETTIDVQPGPASQVRIDVDRTSVSAGERLGVRPVLTDALGNPVSPPGTFELEASPSEGATFGNDSVTLVKAGDVTLTAHELEHDLFGSTVVSVTAGTPLYARLALSPDRLPPGQSVTASLIGIDAYGNEAALPATLEVSPPDGVQLSGGTIRFNEEGVFTVTATGSEFADHDQVTVDGTPPLLTITSPTRGSFQLEAPLTVSGTVQEDVAGIDQLQINGVDAVLSGDAFTLDLDPVPGINILEVNVADLNGNRTALVQSFLYAPAWTPLGGTTPDGLYARLNQPSIDLLTDELEAELNADDLEQLLLDENPIYTYESSALTTEVNVLAFDYADLEGVMTPRGDSSMGYLEIRATFYDLSATLEAHGKALLDTYKIQGTFSATEGVADTDAYVTIEDGEVNVALEQVSVRLYGFTMEFDDEVLDDIADAMSDFIEEELEAELETYIEEEVPGFLEDALAELSFSTAVTVTIGDASAPLTIDTELSTMRFDDAGATIGEATWVGTDVDPEMPPSPGAPRVGAGDLSFDDQPAYVLAASCDALNTVLHALWSSGILAYSYVLEMDGGQTITAVLSLSLPPVLKPSEAAGFDLDATAGDMIVDLFTDGSSPTYRLAVSAVVPTQILEGGAEISVAFGDPEIVFQVLEQPEHGLDTDTLTRVVDELAVELLASAEEELTNIPLPEFEGYQPTVTQVDVRGSDWGYFVVGGDLSNVATTRAASATGR